MGILITAVSGLANFVMGVLLLRRGKAHHSLVLRASGQHLRSDALSSAGLVVGLGLLYLTGLTWIDQLVAILFGLVILRTGYRLVRRSMAGILDEADQELLGELVDSLEANKRPNWIDVHNLRVIQYGATLHLDCHLTIPWYFDVRTAHGEVKQFEETVADSFELPVELFIHTDPCLPPDNCAICSKADCDDRRQPQQKKVPWTLAYLLQDQRHLATVEKNPPKK